MPVDSLKAFDESKYMKITEGTATMYYDKKEAVFYNKVQVFNRDLSIQVIRLFASIVRQEREAAYQAKLEKYNNNTNKSNVKPPVESDYGITILDALAATGLRSVRYLKEIEGVRHVTINDILPAATAQASENCRLNGVDESKVIISTSDATMLMYTHRDPSLQYDVIDLDPYGSATPFLDSAVQAVSHGGLLCVTCTDMTVLSGNYPEVCFSKYGTMPLKGVSYLHEMSLRILLHAIDSTANKYHRHIVPWLSISVDFYVRVFLRVYDSPAEVKRSSLKRAMVYQSLLCPSFFLQPLGRCNMGKRQARKLHEAKLMAQDQDSSDNIAKAETTSSQSTKSSSDGMTFVASNVSAPSKCPETGGNMKLGGPFWTDPIHHQEIVDELLSRIENPVPHTNDFTNPPSTAPRINGILASISEELKDVPFHYNISDLASTVRIAVPNMTDFNSALINAGYRVSQFHREPLAVKTDAPDNIVWDVVRYFATKNPPSGSKNKKLPDYIDTILTKKPELESVNTKYTPVSAT